MKRGQITIFIILGLVLLLSVAAVLYFAARGAERVQQEAPAIAVTTLDRAIITEYATECLRKTALDNAYALALHGGYLNPRGNAGMGEPGDSLPVHYYFEQGHTSFAVNGKEVTLRPLSIVTKMLERAIAAEMNKCLDFKELKKQGYAISLPDIDWQAINFDFAKAFVHYAAQPVNITVIPRAQDLVVTANYPLLFRKGDYALTVSAFSTTVPVRLMLVHSTAQRLAQAIARAQPQPYALQLHCAEYAAQDGLMNVYTTIRPYRLDSLVSIVDTSPVKYGSVPLRFNFAVRNARLAGACTG